MDDNQASRDRHRFTGEMLSPGAASGRLLFLQSDFTLLGPDQRRATREPLEKPTHLPIPASVPVKFARQRIPGDRSSTSG